MLQYWMWKRGRPVLMPLSADDPPLRMTSGTNTTPHIIKQHSNAVELKGLGVYLNFLGTFAYHATTMLQKFEGIARTFDSRRYLRFWCETSINFLSAIGSVFTCRRVYDDG